jgi:Fe2+ or Zn2+ uptake regulation protein
MTKSIGILRDAGYKATPGRLLMLDVLKRAHQPLTVPELQARLPRHRLDTVTLYRTLALLQKINLVRAINISAGITHYELVPAAEHHHIVCTNCHRVADVTNCCVAHDMDRQALKQSGFAQITTHALEFFGLCQKCNQAAL